MYLLDLLDYNPSAMKPAANCAKAMTFFTLRLLTLRLLKHLRSEFTDLNLKTFPDRGENLLHICRFAKGIRITLTPDNRNVRQRLL